MIAAVDDDDACVFLHRGRSKDGRAVSRAIKGEAQLGWERTVHNNLVS